MSVYACEHVSACGRVRLYIGVWGSLGEGGVGRVRVGNGRVIRLFNIKDFGSLSEISPGLGCCEGTYVDF